MKKIKLLGPTLLVFHPINKALVEGSSFLLKPRYFQGNWDGQQEHWVVDASEKTRHVYEKGKKVYTANGACFVYTQHLDLWADYKDLPEFKELKLLQEQTQCDIETKLLYESRIIMVEGGDSNEHGRIKIDEGKAS